MDNPATPADLAARGFDGASTEVQQTRLDEAWRALQVEIPDLVARIISGEVDPAGVVDVLCAAALRVLRNPEGIVSGSGGIDDYQESWKRGDSSADLYFTAAELRRLQPKLSALIDFSGSLRYL